MDRANRVLLAVLGAVLLVAGLAVGLAGLGLVPAVDPGTPLLPDPVRVRWHGWGVAAWLVAAAVGVLLALAGVLLVRAQLVAGRGHRMPDLLRTDPHRRAPASPAEPETGTGGSDRAAPPPDAGSRSGGTATATLPAATATGPGRTRVRSAALVRGIERDLARHPAVRRADVLLAGDTADPRARVRLELRSGADVPQVQSYLSACLARFAGTTDVRPTDVEVVVYLTDRDQVRVR